ncbi:MAG: cysteine synthase family protein [Candidatus Dependentiae bacterium]|nr:cysteine synthase family protein [Candidatus Dependentiae bacterium]
MKYESLLHVIGNTPLVRVKFDTPARVYAKLEYLNPAGSLKDRSALFMVEEAERTGKLRPGGTIIEASSGNQGIATALVGCLKGYKVIITVSEKISKEKQDTLKAYGAELVVCKASTELDDPEGYYQTAVNIQKKTPNSFMLAQYYNEENARSHYYGLGPEIWNQTYGELTHFIGALGSGGTVRGVGTYLKERNKNIQIVGVDVANSYRATGGHPKPYKLEGIGVDYDSPHIRAAKIDEYINVMDDDAIAMLRTMARKHGMLVGPSGGAVAAAAYEYTKKLTAKDLVVMTMGDSGRAYLTKNFF